MKANIICSEEGVLNQLCYLVDSTAFTTANTIIVSRENNLGNVNVQFGYIKGDIP